MTFFSIIQIICSKIIFNIDLQMKPDAMNHIDQWSSGGEGSINTDPNSIKVFVILFTEGILSNAHGCFQGWG